MVYDKVCLFPPILDITPMAEGISFTISSKVSRSGFGPIGHGNLRYSVLPVCETCDFPAATDVRDGVLYGEGSYVGTLELPDESDVADGVGYGAGGTEFEGTFVGSTTTAYAWSF